MRKQSGWEFVLIDDGGRLLGRFHFHAEAENMRAKTLCDPTLTYKHWLYNTSLSHATLNKLKKSYIDPNASAQVQRRGSDIIQLLRRHEL